jgi:hypothetical protein
MSEIQFSGPATRLTDADIDQAGAALGVSRAHVLAVCEVETGVQGAFDANGRPTILFERHYFHRLTGGMFDVQAPDLSDAKPGGYGKYSMQYPKLMRAVLLDRAAALRSASWGAFQIMGDNHKICGFDSVESFVSAMVSGEAAHLKAFVAFVKHSKLDDELRRGDWAAFARGYNGPGYKDNRYDEKLADAFRRHS